MTTLHDFTLRTLDGRDLDLATLRGKTVLMVNVASRCGLTPQYKGLQALYEEFAPKGFVIVGVPANEFGAQEPGTDAEIKGFCETNYAVTFPMLSKIKVKGEGIHPLYAWLTSVAPAGDITWNFEKFLIDGHGAVAQRFAPSVAPDAKDLRDAITRLVG
jgi:glutathione peroxidase